MRTTRRSTATGPAPAGSGVGLHEALARASAGSAVAWCGPLQSAVASLGRFHTVTLAAMTMVVNCRALATWLHLFVVSWLAPLHDRLSNGSGSSVHRRLTVGGSRQATLSRDKWSARVEKWGPLRSWGPRVRLLRRVSRLTVRAGEQTGSSPRAAVPRLCDRDLARRS